jgi:hypothetical protein
MMRLFRLAVAVSLLACSGNATTPPVKDGSAERSVDTTACGSSSFFTACVHACGETTASETTAARCVDGKYQCDAPLVPATACGPGAWTAPRLACGPWVAGYDCGQGCAVCDASRGWTCGECPDASVAASL